MVQDGIATEEQLLAAASGGERVVARVRLALLLCLVAIPTYQIAYSRAASYDLLIGLGATGIALLLSALFYALSRRPRYLIWLPYVTSISDVTLVSFALAVFLVFDEPHVAINSRVIWEVYLLAIGATALRPRRGVVAVTTAVAIVEYLLIVIYADTHWNLNAASWVPFRYGMFDWTSQISRMIIMATAGILALAITRETTLISRLAGTDSLTGIFNRTYFELRLDEEAQRAQRYRHPLTLVMADIDRFKSINDEMGHEYGDKALKQVAEVLKTRLRSSDILFRYGGDELAILMPETGPTDANDILHRVFHSLSERDFNGRSLTLSAGIAALPVDAHDAPSLIQAADSNLYRAKQQGRNRIMPSSLENTFPGPSA